MELNLWHVKASMPLAICRTSHSFTTSLSLSPHLPLPPFPLARTMIRKNVDRVRHPVYATLLEQEHLLSRLHGAPSLAVAIVRVPCSVPKVSDFLLHFFSPFRVSLTTFFTHTGIANHAGATSRTSPLYCHSLVRFSFFVFVSEFTLTAHSGVATSLPLPRPPN